MKRVLLILFLASFLPTPALAYNFLYIHPTSGEPITWEAGTTIEYYLDPANFFSLFYT